MFQNKMRDLESVQSDPFANMNASHEMPIQDDNPFGEILENSDMSEINPEQHFVHPHYVQPYNQEDGTYVEGYWRDGDGDTNVDLSVEDGGGYMQTNPDDDLLNNFNSSIGIDDLTLF